MIVLCICAGLDTLLSATCLADNLDDIMHDFLRLKLVHCSRQWKIPYFIIYLFCDFKLHLIFLVHFRSGLPSASKTNHLHYLLSKILIKCHSDDVNDPCRCKNAKKGDRIKNIKCIGICLVKPDKDV